VAPIAAVPAVVLPLAWIWPVLLWSRLGTQRHEYEVDALLGAYAGARRRMLAAWAAGLVFVPALALAFGVSSRTHRLFRASYLALWYAVLNGIAAIDFMGAVRVDGRPAGPAPLLVGTLALTCSVPPSSSPPSATPAAEPPAAARPR
jgi:hypothetical protein